MLIKKNLLSIFIRLSLQNYVYCNIFFFFSECLERKPKHLDLKACFFLANRQSYELKNIDLRKAEVYVPFMRNMRGKKCTRRKRMKPKTKSSSSSSPEQDVIFESCYIPASQLKSLMKVKNGTNGSDSSADTDDSSHTYIGSDTTVSSNVNYFQTYSLSVIDYVAFNLNIFQECVFLDAKFKDVKACTSPPVLEFSFRLLRDVHSQKYKFSGWPEESVEDVKYCLLELLFLSSSVARVSFGK